VTRRPGRPRERRPASGEAPRPGGSDAGATPGVRDDPADAAALARHAATLAEAIERAIPGWVERSVRRVLGDQHLRVDADLAGRIGAAASAARTEGGPRVRRLLETDIDRQRGNPLAVLRGLVHHPTAVLREAGARPVARDDFSERSFPDDVYDLSPGGFADVDPALHEPGLVWGAAKAHVHLARRRREGRR
jgi:hypothetical protein